MWNPAEVTDGNCNIGIMTDPFCFCILRNSNSNYKKTMLNFSATFWKCNDSLKLIFLSEHDILLKCKNFASLSISTFLPMCILPNLQAKKYSVIFCISFGEHTPTHKCSLPAALLLAYLSACSMIGFENIGCKVSPGRGREIIHH